MCNISITQINLRLSDLTFVYFFVCFLVDNSNTYPSIPATWIQCSHWFYDSPGSLPSTALHGLMSGKNTEENLSRNIDNKLKNKRVI